jgi:hypothetical protein
MGIKTRITKMESQLQPSNRPPRPKNVTTEQLIALWRARNKDAEPSAEEAKKRADARAHAVALQGEEVVRREEKKWELVREHNISYEDAERMIESE